MAQAQVVVVGSCMIDLLSYAPRLPQSGETLHGNKFAVGFGGKGCNQCVAARKLGAECLLVARTFRPSCTRLPQWSWIILDRSVLVEELAATEFADETGPVFIGTWAGLVQGENQIVIVGGANDHLQACDVQRSREAITQSRVLLTQMEIPVEATLEALRIKKSAKGLEVSSVQQAYSASKELQRRGCQHVIITLGELGAVYAPPNSQPLHFPAHKAQVLDTTGAGDAFLGALAFFMSQSEKPDYLSSIRKAIIVASISVERPGTQTSFPDLEEISIHLH